MDEKKTNKKTETVRLLKESYEQSLRIANYIYAFLAFFLLFPVVLHLSIGVENGLFVSKLGFDSWLLFWGNYIGGFAAFCAIYVGYMQNKANHRELIDKQEKNQKKLIDEQDRKILLEVLPFLDISGLHKSLKDELRDSIINRSSGELDRTAGYIILEEDNQFYYSPIIPEFYQKSIKANSFNYRGYEDYVFGFNKDFIEMPIIIKNIGKGVATDITFIKDTEDKLENSPRFNLSVGGEALWRIILKKSCSPGNQNLKIRFGNMYGNHSYVQRVLFDYDNTYNIEALKLKDVTVPL